MSKILDWFKRKWISIIISITIVSLIVFIVRSSFKIHNKITKSEETNLECDSVKTRVLNIVLAIIIIFLTVVSIPSYVNKISTKLKQYKELKNKNYDSDKLDRQDDSDKLDKQDELDKLDKQDELDKLDKSDFKL